MILPRGDEYSIAIQNPSSCFSDNDLKLGTVQTNNLGLPIPYSGGFTTTYKVRNGNFSWAVRCFTREIGNLQKRYQAIDEFIHKTGCDYLVEARYLKHGIQVNNEWSSIIKMHWIEGDLLNIHIGKILNKTEEVESLLRNFVNLIKKLHRDKISHGDLQHGNIIVRNDKLFLIDYDGMFLSEITAVGTGEVGHPNYQHPKRSIKNFDGKLDDFSSLVIYLALNALLIKPELWKKYNNAENILFKKEDFFDPLNSELFYELSQIEELKHLANNLAYVCLSDFSKIPSLENFIKNKKNLGKLTFNSPKPKQTENSNDFFGNLYKKQATTTGGFQYQPTHTLPDPGVTNAQTNPTYTNSIGNLPKNPSKKTKSVSSNTISPFITWAIVIGILLFFWWLVNANNSTVIDPIPPTPPVLGCPDGTIKNSAGDCITRDQNCQNTNGMNSYWDGSYCSCKNDTIWNKSKTKCITQLAYCQGLNGTNAAYNQADNTCGCAAGYELNSNGVCALPVTLTNDQICKRDIPNSYWGGEYGTNGGPICPCNTGYVTSSDGKSCVVAPLTNDQKCVTSYGLGSYYTGQTNAQGGPICDCRNGSSWNTSKTACISDTQFDAQCKSKYGSNTYYTGQKNSSGNTICDCKSGYYWNDGRTACYSASQYDQGCKSNYGSGSYYSTYSDSCSCSYGYTYSSVSKWCVANQ